jgi:heme oxygenase
LQVSAHVRRIEAVEKDLKALGEASASKEDISRVRAEMKKLYDGLHVGRSSSLLLVDIYC